MGTLYEADIIAWATEQAQLLRSGNLTALDLEHIAEEIEDVGKSEQRELASRMAVLLCHLLKWQFQASHRSKSWERTIREQRKALSIRLKKTPSLQLSLQDQDWIESTWADAVAKAVEDTGLDSFPESCIWDVADVLRADFLPAQ